MNAILVDVTRCTGCESCVAACIKTNKGNPVKAEVDRVASRDGLSANRLLSLVQADKGRFARKSCLHCLEPACVSACLVGGLTKTQLGPVVYDPAKCIGCRYCMLSCPYYIPRYEWDNVTPLVRKCDMCYDRLLAGGLPACVEACPNGALTFGERSDLLKMAHERIAGEPGLFKSRVWGEHEFGGASVLYISDVDLDSIGWPERETAPIPTLTEPLIAKTPFIGMFVASGLVGLNWIIGRRMKIEKEKAAQEKNTSKSSDRSDFHDK